MNPIFFIAQLCFGLVCNVPQTMPTKQIFVEKVTNSVQIGPLAGNRGLEFGVKNILEEFLLEKEFELTPTAENRLRVEIVYLDVLTTKKNISVFHQNAEEVVIRLIGTIVNKDNKVLKKAIAEESSAEISMSTLIIDQGGKFNQTSLSNALKKASETLIGKLTN
jgi:hypothetical protein